MAASRLHRVYDPHMWRAPEADEAGLVFAVVEAQSLVAGVERDAAVVQVARGRLAGRDRRAPPLALVRCGDVAGLFSDLVRHDLFAHKPSPV